MPDPLAPDLRVHRHRAHLAEVRPQHVQGAATDQFTGEFGDPELLHSLVQRYQVLLQQDPAGVDVDERLHRRNVGCAGPPDDKPLRRRRALGRGRIGRSTHTCEGIGSGNRYSVAVPGQPHTDPVVPRARVANIANVLTGVRLVLVPVFLVVLFVGDGHETFWRVAAFIVFAVAVITDRFDGALARSYGMVTEFGTLADPIADKALIGAARGGVSILHALPWWVTVVIMAREIGITALRFAVLRRGVIPASRGGKLKTLVQGIAIGLFVLPLSGSWLTAAWVVMWAAVVLTVLTGVDYVVSAARDSRGRPAGQ